MTASNVFENGILSLIFENTNYAGVGDATGLRGSTTPGNFFISLHTTPGPVDTDATQTGGATETTYGSYARQAVARSTAGWTTASGVVSNDAAITFPACTSGTSTVTHFGIGELVSGAGALYFSGALTASLAISTGITPSFSATALTVTAD